MVYYSIKYPLGCIIKYGSPYIATYGINNMILVHSSIVPVYYNVKDQAYFKVRDSVSYNVKMELYVEIKYQLYIQIFMNLLCVHNSLIPNVYHTKTT